MCEQVLGIFSVSLSYWVHRHFPCFINMVYSLMGFSGCHTSVQCQREAQVIIPKAKVSLIRCNDPRDIMFIVLVGILSPVNHKELH